MKSGKISCQYDRHITNKHEKCATMLVGNVLLDCYVLNVFSQCSLSVDNVLTNGIT